MKYREITENIIGAAFEVHKELGSGFPEVIYQRACVIEFEKCDISFKREFSMPVYYRGHHIGIRRVDFLVEEMIPVELKATSKLDDCHLWQALNYLEAWNAEVGLLLNFGSKSLEIKRLINLKFKPKS